MSEQTKKTTTRPRKSAEKPAEEKKAQTVAPDPEEAKTAADTPEGGAPDPENAGGNNESGGSGNDAGDNGNAKTDPENTAGGWEVARVLKVSKPLMKGDDVKALQAALIAHNYHCGVTGVDGVFGRNTAYAVRCFQSANRLVVDGKAGRYTVAALGGAWKG